MLKTPPIRAFAPACRRRGAGQLHRRQHVHRDAGGADRVALGLEAARGVDRQLAVALGPALEDGALALAGRGEAHGLVLDQLGDGEAVVRLDEGRGRARSSWRAASALLPGERGPSKATMSRLLIGRKSLTCSAARKATAFFMPSAVSTSARTTAAAPSETRRAVGALERAGDERVLVGDVAAELVAETPSASGHRGWRRRSCGSWRRSGPARRTGRRSAGSRLWVILPKTPAKPALDVAFLGDVGRLIAAPRVAVGASSVIFSTPTTRTMRAPCAAIVVQALVDGGRAGGAGVLDPGRGLEAQGRDGPAGQRGMELLGDEAAVHVADIDDVDVLGFDAGMGDGLGRGLHDQGFAGLGPRACRTAVGPSDDAGRRGISFGCQAPIRYAMAVRPAFVHIHLKRPGRRRGYPQCPNSAAAAIVNRIFPGGCHVRSSTVDDERPIPAGR